MRQAASGMLVIAALAGLVYWAQPDLSDSASPVLDELTRALSSPKEGPGRSPGAPRNPGAPRRPDGPPGGFRFPSPPLIEALDANRDGELDADEVANAAGRLKSLDRNGDGELTEDELLFPGGPGFGGPGGPGGPGFGGPGGPGFGGPGGPGPGGPGGGRRTLEVLSRFDDDKDGMLNRVERARARAFAKEQGSARGGMFGRGPGGPFGGRGPRGEDGNSSQKPGKRLSPEEVAQYPDAGLYDPHVLRTLFFVFDSDAWEEELEDFRNTDVEVPANLIVDGKTYANVGLRFRGNTSMGVPRGKRRPLNVSIDPVDKKQRLLGYRTLNLLNAHSDPSFLRTVLFDQIAGDYLPAPRANLVRVVINGESWGVYVNEQQFNKDFAKEWFGEGDGARWKAPVNFSGSSALAYHGENEEAYRGLYELKARNEKQAWHDLVDLCKQLEQLPDDKLETELDRVLNVDRALWFLAVDNVLMDDDGYFSRGSDYCIYQDCTFGRFHLVHRDSNETFRFGGGPGPGGPGGGPGGRGRGRGSAGGGPSGPGGGPGGPGDFGLPGGPSGSPGGRGRRGGDPGGGQAGPGGSPDGSGGGRSGPGGGPGGGPGDLGFGGPGGFGPPGGPGGRGSGATLDPLSMVDSKARPLIRRLLSNANLRARYLAHVRTIVDEWLDWQTLGPVFEDYRALIVEEVLSDPHNPSTFAEFFDSDVAEPSGGGPFGAPPGLKRFVEARRAYLLKHSELAKPRPAILSVERPGGIEAGKSVQIAAQVGQKTPVAVVLLYYAVGRGAAFQKTEMKADPAHPNTKPGAWLYGAAIPATPAGADVYYYVEARAEKGIGTTTFSPRRTELGAIHYRVHAPPDAPQAAAGAPRIVLNEIMASNTRTLRSPRDKFEDWIELANIGKEEADVSGMHLTDDKQKPHKWTFPSGTRLGAGQYLLVWADEDTKAKRGLHANFKLSQSGEVVLLVDSDARGSAILDAVEFRSQRADVSLGRWPDGTGKWQLLPPTPGKPNSDQ